MENLNIPSIKDKADDFFEGNLRKWFKPIPPDPDFVQKLKKRLLKKSEIYLEQDSPSILLLLIIGGMVFGIFIFWFISKIFRK